MSWKIFNLVLSATNVANTILNYSNHQYYWAMFSAFIAVIGFGMFIHYIFKDLFKIQKPRKEENIYE